MLRIVSITVAHYPNPDLLLQQLRGLQAQVHALVVVDNGSGNAGEWHRRAANEAGADILVLPDNVGIAAAQNAGIRHALDSGATHVLLMDHDSLPASNMVSVLLSAAETLQSAGVRAAALGPVCVDRRTGSPSGFVKLKGFRVVRLGCDAAVNGLVEADFLIASGTLIAASTLEVVGLMNAGYFIDHVDTEWCLRARAQDMRIFGVCDARLDHHLGDRVVRIWMGRWREVPIHSPLRNYYMFRNTVLMLRTVPMSWIWRLTHLYRMMQYVVFSVLVVAPRDKRMVLMAKGVWHGLIGRTGPLKGACAKKPMVRR